ncbi:MAG: leucine-rich repeat protein [Lachnospiraceae bacterium]|nr:leucine-rich repeat protein [Lachnospiraceae bacterium]
MKFLRDTGKKYSTGSRFAKIIAALFAVIFAFTSLPSADAFADTTSKVMNPGYIFRDEKPDSTGIPAYYHKGAKYTENREYLTGTLGNVYILNEYEKKLYDQVVLLHMYLTDANRNQNSFLSQFNNAFNSGDFAFVQAYQDRRFFSIDSSRMPDAYKIPSVEIRVEKPGTASGGAVSYYTESELRSLEGSSTVLSDAISSQFINFGRVMEALFVDLPDLFWWDKTCVAWNYSYNNGSNGGIVISGINVYLASQLLNSGEYYTKYTIPQTMTTINDFAYRVIDEVESKGFWETVKGGEEAVVTEVPGVLSDYDKLVGTALMLEKLIKYDTACLAAGGDVNRAKHSSLGIDCVTQYSGWGTHLYDSSDVLEAVCEGYAEIYKYICDRTRFYNDVKMGIEIGYVENKNLETGVTTYGRHEWNIATIEDASYVIDLTNDDFNWLRTDLNSSVSDAERYKYKNALLLKGKKSFDAFDQNTQPEGGKGYYIQYSYKDSDGVTHKITPIPFYLFEGTTINISNDLLPLVTEAVGYEPSYSGDFIKCLSGKYYPILQIKDSNNYWDNDSLFDNTNSVPQIIYKDGESINRGLYIGIQTGYGSTYETSYEYELIKVDEFADGVVPPQNGTVVKSGTFTDVGYHPMDVNFGDPHDLAPGNYTIYVVVNTWSGYSYPLKGQSFTVLPATLTPSVAVKNGSGKVTIASSEINNDLKDRFEIKLEGVASGDEVSAQITSLQLTNVVDSTTTTEGSAGISATFTLTGKDAQNYVLASNYTTTVTLDNAITISKKQPATNPEQGGTSGGGTVGGGTVGGETTGGETVGGGTEGGETVGGGTSGGGTVGGGTEGGGTSGDGTVGGGTVGGGTVGGGTSGGGTVGGGSVGGGTSGGGAVSGGGGAVSGGGGAISGGGGAISGGGGAISGGGATSGGTDSTKKDDETADEKKDDKASDDKKDDKASDDKKDDKASDDKKDDKKEDDGTVVVENEDGSVTTTNISVNKKGSVIVESVTENTDGSIVETKVKTTKSGKVTETNVEKDADGNVLSTVESTYSVSSKGTVKMTAIETDEKEVEIPKTVEVAGEERTVTQIAKYALKNNKTMTSARIGENITSIGAGAFKNNKKLKTIELTDSVKKVYKNAFKGIAKNAVFKIKASSKKKFDKIVALLKASGVSDTVTFEMVE